MEYSIVTFIVGFYPTEALNEATEKNWDIDTLFPEFLEHEAYPGHCMIVTAKYAGNSNTASYASLIEWDVDNDGTDIFSEWAENLFKLFLTRIEKAKQIKTWNYQGFCLPTVWSHEVKHTPGTWAYPEEWEARVKLLGVLDVNKLPLAVTGETL